MGPAPAPAQAGRTLQARDGGSGGSAAAARRAERRAGIGAGAAPRLCRRPQVNAATASQAELCEFAAALRRRAGQELLAVKLLCTREAHRTLVAEAAAKLTSERLRGVLPDALCRAVAPASTVRCLKLGVRLPARVYEQLAVALAGSGDAGSAAGSSLEVLSLSGSCCGDAALGALLPALGSHPLRVLELAGCCLGDASARRLAALLRGQAASAAQATWVLGLRGGAGSASRGARAGRQKEAAAGLQVVDLSHNQARAPRGAGGAPQCPALRCCVPPGRVDAGGAPRAPRRPHARAQFTAAGLPPLAAALCDEHGGLAHLGLAGNPLAGGAVAAAAALLAALQREPPARAFTVDLRGGECAGGGADALVAGALSAAAPMAPHLHLFAGVARPPLPAPAPPPPPPAPAARPRGRRAWAHGAPPPPRRAAAGMFTWHGLPAAASLSRIELEQRAGSAPQEERQHTSGSPAGSGGHGDRRAAGRQPPEQAATARGGGGGRSRGSEASVRQEDELGGASPALGGASAQACAGPAAAHPEPARARDSEAPGAGDAGDAGDAGLAGLAEAVGRQQATLEWLLEQQRAAAQQAPPLRRPPLQHEQEQAPAAGDAVLEGLAQAFCGLSEQVTLLERLFGIAPGAGDDADAPCAPGAGAADAGGVGASPQGTRKGGGAGASARQLLALHGLG
ncbi:hypothetical protein HT031_004620 [Scenedesmus sp. PABB004]|nr:hypothetical protein HT031_004620 [Scenedesmus sp. PABB004]